MTPDTEGAGLRVQMEFRGSAADDKTRNVLEKLPKQDSVAAFDALVGYLRSSGWFAVRPMLEHVPGVRVLVGINVDTLIADYQKRGLLFHGAEGETLEQLKASLQKDIEEAEYSPHVEQGILQFIEDVASKRIQVRAHPTKNFHAKIYIFRPEGFNAHKPGAVITGSSNLTEAGLGARGPESNYEIQCAAARL